MLLLHNRILCLASSFTTTSTTLSSPFDDAMTTTTVSNGYQIFYKLTRVFGRRVKRRRRKGVILIDTLYCDEEEEEEDGWPLVNCVVTSSRQQDQVEVVSHFWLNAMKFLFSLFTIYAHCGTLRLDVAHTGSSLHPTPPI